MKSKLLFSVAALIFSITIFSTSVAAQASFDRTLKPGDKGQDVSTLQTVLNAAGKIVAPEGPGSPGNETDTYGNMTASAIQSLQCDNGIVCSGTPETTGYGATGPRTRTLLNSLLTAFESLYSQPGVRNTAAISDFDNVLVGKWTFDDISGTTAPDTSGNGNNGRLYGSPTVVTGRAGGALEFNGSSYVEIPNSNVLNVNQGSFSYWFKSNNALSASSNRQDLFAKTLSYWLILNYPQKDGRFSFVLNRGNPIVFSTGASWNASEWHLLTGTNDGTTLKLYVDGTLQGTAASAPIEQSNSPITIGKSVYSSGFIGAIDDVRVYSRALSAGEVADLYAISGGTPPPPPPPASGTNLLSVYKSGTGTGLVSGGGISGIACGSTCSKAFSSQSVITLNAYPDTGSTFVGWSGACSGTGACSADMSTVRNVTAEFAISTTPPSNTTYTVTIRRIGTALENGIVTGPGVSCGLQCTATVTSGSPITFTATPGPNAKFSGWTLACAQPGAASGNTCTLRPTSNNIAYATFDIDTDNPPPTQTAALVAQWEFNNQSNPGVDSSGNGRNLTLNGPVWNSGGKDGSLYFDGVNDFANAGSIMPTRSSYTKMAWVKRGTVSSNNNIISGSSGHALWAPAVYSYQVASGHNPSYPSYGFQHVFSPTVLDNNWHHVAVVYDYTSAANTGIISLYVDGSLVSARPATPPNTDSSLQVGAYNSANFWSGFMDDVRIYNGALTPAAIVAAKGTTPTGGSIVVNPPVTPAPTPTGPYTLTVNKTGFGSVSSNLSGITCGTSCTSTYASYAAGTSVTLTATPGTGQTTSWSGCTPAGTGLTCSVSMTSARTVSVTFVVEDTQLPPTPPPAPGNLPSGLVGRWQITEGSGDTVSDSAGSHHGKLEVGGDEDDNQNLINRKWVTDSGRTALKFDGINDFVDLGSALPSGSYTKSIWIKPMPRGECGVPSIMSGDGTSKNSSSHVWWVPDLVNNSGTVAAGHNTSKNSLQATQSLSVGNWYHVALSYDASSRVMNYYQNGVLAGTANGVASQNDTYLAIGNFGKYSGTDHCNRFTGYVDDAQVYKRALTATEVASIAGAVATPPPAGTYSITINKTGTGASIGTVSGVGISSGINCGSVCVTSITQGATVTLNASAGSSNTFTGWSGCTTTNATSCTVDMTSSKTVNAGFTAVVAPPAPSCNSLKSLYVSSSVRTLSEVNVRSLGSLSGTVVGTQLLGALGSIVSGPVCADGYVWWNINYATGADGWSAEANIIENVIDTPPSNGSQFYVSPNGSASGNGSITNPWDIKTALTKGRTVPAGSTIWLRAGRHVVGKEFCYVPAYSNCGEGSIHGAPGNYITVRSYPGEHASIDGSLVFLGGTGGWVIFRDLELYDSSTDRYYNAQSGWMKDNGIEIPAGNMKFINNLIHDHYSNAFFPASSPGTVEFYGNSMYNHGVYNNAPEANNPTGWTGAAIYGQSLGSPRIIENNFIQGGIGLYTLSIYSEGGGTKNFTINKNTFVGNNNQLLLGGGNAGAAGQNRFSNNLLFENTPLFGGADTIVDGNYFGAGYGNNDGGAENVTFSNNEFMVCNVPHTAGTRDFIINASLSQNKFHGVSFANNKYYRCSPTSYDLALTGNGLFSLNSASDEQNWKNQGFDNAPGWDPFVPSFPADKYAINENKYEVGKRWNLSVFNWDNSSSVTIPVSSALAAGDSFLRAGDQFEIHNAFDFYNQKVTGTYNGSSITINMNNWSVPKPIGWDESLAGRNLPGKSAKEPYNTFPTFGAFIITKI
jgi:hypothetical protein